jgi:mevalonate kinase
VAQGPGNWALLLKHKMEKYVNSVMQEINELMTELYEAMMDNDSKEVQKIIDKIIPQLRDIKSTYTDEQV